MTAKISVKKIGKPAIIIGAALCVCLLIYYVVLPHFFYRTIIIRNPSDATIYLEEIRVGGSKVAGLTLIHANTYVTVRDTWIPSETLELQVKTLSGLRGEQTLTCELWDKKAKAVCGFEAILWKNRLTCGDCADWN